MAEQSGFFDAHLVNGEYDRIYLAEHFAKYFASFIGNGIFGGKSNELMVRERETPNMGVKVLSGQAWIDGYWYENDGEHPLTIDVADGVLHRIDSIVVRWNHSERNIRLAVKKGTAATNPVAPTVQRNDDFYELKLADISVRAGTTTITQANITDKRLNTDVCGLVIGVVQQLDPDEFGIQLETYISEFIAEHDAWKNATQSDIEQWAAEFKTSYTNWFTQFKADCNAAVNALIAENQTRIDNLISTGQTNINNVVTTGQQNIAKVVSDGTTNINKVVTDGQTSINGVVTKGQQDIKQVVDAGTESINQVVADGQQRFDNVIGELEELSRELDLVQMTQDVAELQGDVEALDESVKTLEGLNLESSQYTGCFYRIVNNNVEWINPPSMPGFEYMTTERWNGKPVYVKTIYLGVLSNKTMIAVTIDAEYDKVFFVSGYAFDPENNMSYPFPIILNGLTPIAVISGVEGNGSESNIIINVNEDLSAFSGYITVKYVKT